MASGRLRSVDRDVMIALGAAAWITTGLLLDRGASLAVQRAIGVTTWVILVAFLHYEPRLVRWQVMAAVAIATCVEVIASLVLQLYIYRLENIPSFVPPGHGVVYFAALAIGRSRTAKQYEGWLRWSTLAVALTWAAWGITLSPSPDSLGAALSLCFAGFVIAGRAPRMYAACFLMASFLELLGTAAGTWTWGPSAGVFTAGNPPSGIAGGYCVLDCLALTLGSYLASRIPNETMDEASTPPAKAA